MRALFLPSNDVLPASHPASGRRPRTAGRILFDADRSEHPCQATSLSTGEVRLCATVRTRVGERAICYLDRFGRLEGRVSALSEDDFTLTLALPTARRDRLSAKVEQSARRERADLVSVRQCERVIPTLARAVLTDPDGRRLAVRIHNLSRSGAALSCPAPQAVGSRVRLGAREAAVVRTTAGLIAVAFTDIIPAEQFSADMQL